MMEQTDRGATVLVLVFLKINATQLDILSNAITIMHFKCVFSYFFAATAYNVIYSINMSSTVARFCVSGSSEWMNGALCWLL